MIFAPDLLVVFLGTATLLLLSLYTVAVCRAQLPGGAKNYMLFLFQGKTRRYALASSISSAFSLTYYGATTIYGHLYKGWCLLCILLAVIISICVARLVIGRIERPNPGLTNNQTGNVLLDHLKVKLTPFNFSTIITLYLIIYFLLLVEELSVSRLFLNLLFPGHPAITAVLLATICLVILVYLRWGGFQAILIADYEQLKLLLPFLVAMGFLMYRNPTHIANPSTFLDTRLLTSPLSPAFGVITFVPWLVGSVDFYSRLNFAVKNPSSVCTIQKAFATLALALTSIVFLFAALFGISLPATLPSAITPPELTKYCLDQALIGGSRSTFVIFFASLFCMIFTTLNILLFTIFQLGAYRPHLRPSSEHLSRTLLFAVLLSCALWPNHVSAVGIFIATLMIMPFLIILLTLGKEVSPILPHSFSFLYAALALATIVFVSGYRLWWPYSGQWMISAIVVCSFCVCALVFRVGDLIKRRRRNTW